MAERGIPLNQQAVVNQDGLVWLPFDLPFLGLDTSRFTPLSSHQAVFNAVIKPFELDYTHVNQVHIINGCGVALGDAIVGLAVLEQLRRQHPQLTIVVYISPHMPPHVREIYDLASTFITVRLLPLSLEQIENSTNEVWIDLADFMYRPAFNQQPMHDFFAYSLGLSPEQLAPATRANHWLQTLALPALPAELPADYTLLCHRASTLLRSMPDPIRVAWCEQWRRSHNAPLAGFAAAGIPGWHDLSAWSVSLPHFMAAIAGARQIISVDSAAIHLAAGLGIPCTALFMGIDPALRVSDYPLCNAVQLDQEGFLQGLHHARDAADEACANENWRRWLITQTQVVQ